MIEKIITALRNLGIEPTPEELADALWLAIKLKFGHGSPPSKLLDDNKDKKTISSLRRTERRRTFKQDVIDTNTVESKPIYTFPNIGSSEGQIKHGSYFPTPAVPALACKLNLAKALHPLMRKILSRNRLIIDETETAREIAKTGGMIWRPVFRHDSYRWFDIALIVDTGPSMGVWQETIEELQLLLERQGAFEDLYRKTVLGR